MLKFPRLRVIGIDIQRQTKTRKPCSHANANLSPPLDKRENQLNKEMPRIGTFTHDDNGKVNIIIYLLMSDFSIKITIPVPACIVRTPILGLPYGHDGAETVPFVPNRSVVQTKPLSTKNILYCATEYRTEKVPAQANRKLDIPIEFSRAAYS